MADSTRRLILANGEQYIRGITKVFHGRSPEPPRTYEQARENVKSGVHAALQSFEALPVRKRIEGEAVLCLRLHPDATAKSYDPVLLFEDTPELRKVGSRTYRDRVDNVAPTTRVTKSKPEPDAEVAGRIVFVQSSIAGFRRFLTQLDRSESDLRKQARDEIRRIERFDTLLVDEQIVGFESGWKEGRVELVLHPGRVLVEQQRSFIEGLFDEVGIAPERAQIRPYPGGPTFISCRMTRESLDAIAGTNPLRSAHPLEFIGIQNIRGSATAVAPLPSGSKSQSTIRVGMFDGGIDLTVPLIQGHAEEDTSLEIKTAPIPDGIAHGTAVAGALLYGHLNGKTDKHTVDAPPVYVVSIRALPTSDPTDVDMFEAIDVVENAVPARTDIKTFNLSFGPYGPIQDDVLSRFTYVLDTLAFTHKAAFFVAVGNTGDIQGYERIQAPSDLVHGMGVGAYTVDGDKRVPATYSCYGPGRECGKIKPDVSARGGCPDHPVHLVSTIAGLKWLNWGTSFASPLAARLGVQASELFDRGSALLSRALLVHTAVHPKTKPDHRLGHGCIATDIDDILLCEDKTVTIVFQGDILPTNIVRLPVPLPVSAAFPGTVALTWTVAALPPTDSTHATDYTSCCLEDTFYPHAEKFRFSPKKGVAGKATTLHLVQDKAEADALLASGWVQAAFPISESGNKYQSEEARRKLDCLWEPIVRRSVSKQVASLSSPFLTLHAISRNGANERFDYVVVLTITAKKYPGDLYNDIRQRFPALAPIRLRAESEIRVQIK